MNQQNYLDPSVLKNLYFPETLEATPEADTYISWFKNPAFGPIEQNWASGMCLSIHDL